MEENVRINITGDNRDALKKLDKVEQAVNRLNSAAGKVEVRVANIRQTQTQVDRLYQSLQRLENVTLSKLPQSLQTVIVYLKAANKGMAEFTARTATAVSLVRELGVIDFSPTIKQLTAAGDRIDDLIRKRRFLQGQIKSIDTRVERGRIKKPEAIERARKEQELLRESVRKLNAEIDTYNSKALTSYRKQSSALRTLREEYDAVRRALVSLRIEQARVFAFDQKRLRQQGDITGAPQRRALPSTSALTRPLERALRSLTEVIYITVDRVRRIFDSSRLLPVGRKALPKAGELAVNSFNRSLQDLTKIIYVTVGQIARIWASSRLLPPQLRLGAGTNPALAAGAGQTGYPGAARLALTSAGGALTGGGGFVPPGGRSPNPYRGPGGPLGPQARPNNFIVPNNIRGLEAFRAVLNSLVRTAEIGSPEFKRYARSLGQVNKDIAAATGQIAKAQSDPKTIAGKRLEAEALQASLEQAEVGSKNFNELANKLRKVNAELEKTDKRVSGRGLRSRSRGRIFGDAASGAILGGGFPLLTGGPSFSAAGGGVLGGLGGALFGATGGFAGGILGSALGAALDNFTQKALELGRALRDPTRNVQALADAVGNIGSASSRLVSQLQAAGLGEFAGALARENLATQLERGGFTLEKYEKDVKDYDNAVRDLNLAFTQFAASRGIPILKELSSFFRGITSGGGGGDPRSQFPTFTDPVTGATRRGPKTPLQSEAENVLSRKQQNQVDLQNNILNLKRQELQVDAIQRANLEGNLRIQEEQNKLELLGLRIKKEKAGSAAREQLENEKEILEIKLKQLEADTNAARLRAIQQTGFALIDEDVKQATLNAQQQDIFAQNLRKDLTFAGTNLLNTEIDLYGELLNSINITEAAELKRIDSEITKLRQVYNLNEDVRKARELSLLQERNLITERTDAARRNLEIERAAALVQKEQFNLRLQTAALSKKQELETAQAAGPSALFQDAGAGIGFFQDSVTLARQQALEYDQTLEQLQLRFDAFVEAANTPGIGADLAQSLHRQAVEAQLAKEQYEKLQPAINQAKLEQQQFNDALALTTPIVTSLVNGISEVVQGTKSAQEVFANFLKTIGDTLVAEGTRMIATYIAIGIAKAFAGLSGGGSQPNIHGQNVTEVLNNPGLYALPKARASGGPVERNRAYMVGEQGPELFTPDQAGRISSANETRSLLGRSPVGGAPAMNFTFETTNIGGQEYVSREQLEAAMAVTRKQAANDGASKGMSMTLDKMQHSPATRRRVGIG